jgi:hypothetical protein
MRMLVMLVVLAGAAYVMWRLVQGSARPAPALASGEHQEPAAIASGPDRGFGTLRLTPTQLVFLANSGRVVTVERLDITGVTTTTVLPDHDTAKPVLAVATSSGVHYFSVDDPRAWEHRLLYAGPR